MSLPVFIRVFEQNRQVFAGEFNGVVELGRQTDPTEPLHASRTMIDRGRVVIARLDEQTVSRRHLEVERLPSGHIRLKNLSSVNGLTLRNGVEIEPSAVRRATPPASLAIGRKVVQIEEPEPEPEGITIQGLSQATQIPGCNSAASRLPPLDLSLSRAIEPESLVRWLQAVMDVLQSAASSSDFFKRAATGIIELVGLDVGHVLLRDGEDWRVVASGAGAAPDWRPSRRVLARLQAERRTFWQEPDDGVDDSQPRRRASGCGCADSEQPRRSDRRTFTAKGSWGGGSWECRGSPRLRPCSSSCWPAAWPRGWPAWSKRTRRWPRVCSLSSSSHQSWPRSSPPGPTYFLDRIGR